MRGSLARVGLTPAAAVAGLVVIALVAALVALTEFGHPDADPAPRTQTTASGASDHLVLDTYVIDCDHHAVERPLQYTLNCTDTRVHLTDLIWTAWGGSEAHATGTYVRRSCTRPCVATYYVSKPVRVTAHRALRKGRVAIYTSLTVTFTNATPAARPTSTSYDVTPRG